MAVHILGVGFILNDVAFCER